jgi:tRNA uridine 5-carbamoylmethylation protein Kti12
VINYSLQEEIERIRSYLSTSQGNVKVVLLWGLPLVGKSTLARRLAVEFSSSFPDRFELSLLLMFALIEIHRSFHIDIKGAAHSYVEVKLESVGWLVE